MLLHCIQRLVVCNSVEGNEIQTHAKPTLNYFDVKYFTIHHHHHFRLLDGMTERKPIHVDKQCRGNRMTSANNSFYTSCL